MFVRVDQRSIPDLGEDLLSQEDWFEQAARPRQVRRMHREWPAAPRRQPFPGPSDSRVAWAGLCCVFSSAFSVYACVRRFGGAIPSPMVTVLPSDRNGGSPANGGIFYGTNHGHTSTVQESASADAAVIKAEHGTSDVARNAHSVARSRGKPLLQMRRQGQHGTRTRRNSRRSTDRPS